MRKNISLICAILALIAILTLLLDYQIKPSVRTLDDISQTAKFPTHQAPDFAFTDLKDRKLTLDSLKGKIVILHFWATWCPPCIGEFPKITSIAEEFKQNIVLLAVSSDDRPEAIRKFIKTSTPSTQAQDNIYLIWDQNRAITHDLYQTFAYPETIIIDGKGQMVRKIPGEADWTSKDMKSYLQTLVGTLADSAGKP